MSRKIVNIFSKIIDYIVFIFLAILLIYGVYSLYDMYNISNKAKLDNKILHLKPDGENNNENIENLKEFNDDIFAWIELDNTNINYPIVQADTNTEYLKEGYDGEYSVSGSIFLDYRNNKKFTDYYSIVYGHHMDKGLMFGDLDLYKDEKFFNENKTGKLYLQDVTYDIEIFACSLVSAYDRNIFSVEERSNIQKIDFIYYIKENSIFYRDIDLNENSNIIAFSTCANDITSGRLVLFAKVLK